MEKNRRFVDLNFVSWTEANRNKAEIVRNFSFLRRKLHRELYVKLKQQLRMHSLFGFPLTLQLLHLYNSLSGFMCIFREMHARRIETATSHVKLRLSYSKMILCFRAKENWFLKITCRFACASKRTWLFEKGSCKMGGLSNESRLKARKCLRLIFLSRSCKNNQ